MCIMVTMFCRKYYIRLNKFNKIFEFFLTEFMLIQSKDNCSSDQLFKNRFFYEDYLTNFRVIHNKVIGKSKRLTYEIRENFNGDPTPVSDSFNYNQFTETGSILKKTTPNIEKFCGMINLIYIILFN
ncbi:hypothetical protein BpHYR1_040229 [Brachionus plicatilis]|uniref:Uncharacterized protein n=1 Tax=Brachionus plicatilis TaxID=10195 RepID=A0A3M7S1D0_BRAPC|nr:hypothetical protein BpHYR1_040229 [Brachionus plicatilis]